MKNVLILGVLISSVFILYSSHYFAQIGIKKNTNHPQLSTVRWNDSLIKHLPEGMDTSIVVKDIHGTSLKFSQYIRLIFNHEAIIYQDRGVWRLHRTTKSAYDSMSRDDLAVARPQRALAYRQADTIKSWKKKLDQIAHTLALGDYVLVLKSARKMFIQRKGKNISTFTIDLGFKPIGHKVFEGDGKTPEGVYHLDNKYDRDDKFYKSFWISYPNNKDKAIAKSKGLKTGLGIMIHGTNRPNITAKDWTAGCIALQNRDIDVLFDRVAAGTIIEIRK